MTTRAVFIGASNVEPGTWPERLSAAEGWVCHNYAKGGTFFDYNPTSFLDQLDKAIADPSLVDSEVEYVFLAGGGNDCRAGHDVWIPAFNFHHKAQATWPNARIISIPMLWNNDGIHYRLTIIANQMRDAALAWNHEVIWHAWEWLIGLDESYMADPVHPSYKGYTLFIENIRNFIQNPGANMAVNHPDEWSLPAGITRHSRGIVQCVCIDGIVYLTARLTKPGGNFNLGETVMYVPQWAAESRSNFPRPIAGGLSAMDRHAGFYVYPDGRVTVRSTEASGSNEINIAMASWPIGM